MLLRGESTITQLGSKVFYSCSDNLIIYVPNDKVGDYKNADNWKDYAEKIKGLGQLVILADNADNNATIAAADSETKDAFLQGRTLYKDGDWNTLCLPFDVSIASGPLAGIGVQAMTLDVATSGLSGSTLTLNFTAVSPSGEQGGLIPAGTPFIIRWTKSNPSDPDLENLVNPVFSDVTVSNATNNATTADGSVTFTGTYAPVSIGTDGDNTKLYLGAANTLYYPNAAMTIKACRAYFQLNNGLTAGDPASGVRAFNLNFGDGEASGITTTDFLRPDGSKRAELERTDYTDKAGAWFTLDGRKLDGKPTKAGLYIHGGRKVVVK